MPQPEGNSIRAKLARRILELRTQRGLTQRDFARACGISSVFMGTLERAEKSASLETLEKLARGLRVSLPTLLQFHGTKEEAEDPAGQLGHVVASLARSASRGKQGRFEQIARLYFVADGSDSHGRGRGGRRKKAPSRTQRG